MLGGNATAVNQEAGGGKGGVSEGGWPTLFRSSYTEAAPPLRFLQGWEEEASTSLDVQDHWVCRGPTGRVGPGYPTQIHPWRWMGSRFPPLQNTQEWASHPPFPSSEIILGLVRKAGSRSSARPTGTGENIVGWLVVGSHRLMVQKSLTQFKHHRTRTNRVTGVRCRFLPTIDCPPHVERRIDKTRNAAAQKRAWSEPSPY